MSCGFADLRLVDYSVIPGKAYSVINGGYTPLVITFDTEMIKNEAEQLVSVSYYGGTVNGDFRWQGNVLYFTPSAGWSYGVLYTLTISGSAFAKDGRELRTAHYIPFYVETNNTAPVLISYSPANGAPVGVRPEEGTVLVLDFSAPMDSISTEEAFTWDCPGEKNFSWSNGNTRVEITAKDVLTPWTTYHWSLGERALSQERIPLARSFSGEFVTNLDQMLPGVERCYPMIQSGLLWTETGGMLSSDLGINQGIGISFNKAMNHDSVTQSLRFEPALAGNVEILSDTEIVFVPTQSLENETTYTMIVSKETTDISGLKLGEDYIEYFTPDLPYLDVFEISTGSVLLSGPDLENGLCHAVTLTGLNELRITIRFSLMFTNDAVVDMASRIVLEPYFPPSLLPIALQAVIPQSADTVVFEWTGLEAGSAAQSKYYRLSIPGGKGGISNGTSSYLKENRYLYFEVVP
jgi:hypothetical protein